MPSPLSGISPRDVAALLNPTLDLLLRHGAVDSAQHESAIADVWRNHEPRHAAGQYAAAARYVLAAGGLIEGRGPYRWAAAPGVRGPVRDPLRLVAAVMNGEAGPALAAWRVACARDGSLDRAERIALAIDRGARAGKRGNRLAAEQLQELRRRMAAYGPLGRVDGRTLHVVLARGPIAHDDDLLLQAEILLETAREPESRGDWQSADGGSYGRAYDAGQGSGTGPVFGRSHVGGAQHLDFDRGGYGGVAGGSGGGGGTYGGVGSTPDVYRDETAESAGPADEPIAMDGLDLEDTAPAPPPTAAGMEPEGWAASAPPEDDFLESLPESAPPTSDEPGHDDPPSPEPSRARFPDFRILVAGSGAEHPSDRPLKADQEYVLEVTITPDPGGLPATGDRQPIRDPGQPEAVKVFVTAEADDESFVAIDQPLDSLDLPPGSGASTTARFTFRPRRKSAGPGDRAAVMVRMYYRLNLLARTVVSFEVGGKFDDVRRDGAVTVHPQVLDPTLAALDEVVPQDLHIDVTSRADDGYRLNVLYRKPGGEDVVFPARLQITTEGLEDRLRDARDEMHRITSSPEYTSGLQATPDQFAAHLHRLARTGQRLWSKLFDEDQDAAAFDVAAVLRENPPPPGSRIQVTLAPDATEFIFPWGLMFQGEIPKESYVAPDTDGFWGTRYEVEIRLPQSPLPRDRPVEASGGLKLAFMLWEQFRNAKGQKEFIAELGARSGGKLAVGEPIVRASLCKDLLADCDAQVLYFYSHGYTRPRKADTTPDGDPQGAADPDRNRTWIALTNGKLYLDDLMHDVQGKFPSEPLIVLNMCESAEMSPSLSDSFVGFFLDRGARAVVGTECPMTVEFADPFGRRLLEGVLAGQTASRALMEARRHFVRNERNPLGLAYTLYGTASVSFAPPVLSHP
jgi:hypothetical protein